MSAFRANLRPFLKKLALTAASVIVAVLFCEAGLRIFARQPHPYTVDGTSSGDVVYSEFQRNRFNIYVPSRRSPGSRLVYPNPDITHGLSREARFTIDQFGFRSARTITLQKPPGVTRIMAVGGSTTENNLLDDKEVWTEVLGDLLSRQLPGVEVINTAKSGDNSRDHIALLAQVLVAFEPDIAMFLVGVNDLELQMKPDYSILRNDRRSLAPGTARVPFGMLVKVWAADWSHLARLSIRALRGTLTRDERGNPVEDPTSSWVAMKRKEFQALPTRQVDASRWPSVEYEANLRTLIGISRANYIEPVFITQPAIWGAPPGEWESTLWVHPHPDYKIPHAQLWKILESFNDVVRRLGREQDVVVIDLARLLPKTSAIFMDDDHYTVAGSRQVATIIESELNRVDWRTRRIAPPAKTRHSGARTTNSPKSAESS